MPFYAFILAFAAAYLIGAIPFGLFIGLYNGVDIRKTGSCNIGATNVTRCCGNLAGKLCFGCDFLKGFLPTLAATWIFTAAPWAVLATAGCAVLGHVFPCYLKFKGGKGVSTAAGAMLAIAPFAVVVALALWCIVFLTTRYVSVASITASAALIAVVWGCRIGDFAFCGVVAKDLATAIFCTALGIFSIVRHRSNIVRLMQGTENRFERKK
ncbi:MAG: glycerol-3-phosphate 1-O-acyltransferase PlsY [Victivallaceae bacterium]|nr:glycerol-3-phosphate 1-O-acyltransferase PlsY [Victivallaceae bacterium]